MFHLSQNRLPVVALLEQGLVERQAGQDDALEVEAQHMVGQAGPAGVQLVVADLRTGAYAAASVLQSCRPGAGVSMKSLVAVASFAAVLLSACGGDGGGKIASVSVRDGNRSRASGRM